MFNTGLYINYVTSNEVFVFKGNVQNQRFEPLMTATFISASFNFGKKISANTIYIYIYKTDMITNISSTESKLHLVGK